MSPWTGKEEQGSVIITIDGGSNTEGSRVALGWEPGTDSGDLWHRITMIDSSGASTTKDLGVGGGTANFTLAPGPYTVMVSGWLSTVGDTSAPFIQLKSARQKSVTVPVSGSAREDVSMKHDFPPVTVTFDSRGGSAVNASMFPLTAPAKLARREQERLHLRGLVYSQQRHGMEFCQSRCRGHHPLREKEGFNTP